MGYKPSDHDEPPVAAVVGIQRLHGDTGTLSDPVTRMEKLTGSYRSGYETALKHAAASAFVGEVLQPRTNLHCIYRSGLYTVCQGQVCIPLVLIEYETSLLLVTLTLAIVENPHDWRRGHMGIDAVVGTNRFPEFNDRPSLSYIDAILHESLRWRPVSPTSACEGAHSASELS